MITLRTAMPADAPLLRQWDRQPHLQATKGSDDWQWETTLAEPAIWKSPFIAEWDGRAIGFLEIIDPAGDEEGYWGEVPNDYRAIDIGIGEPGALGQGHGTQMMRLALERCFADAGVRAVLVDPFADSTRSHRFYQRLGFVFVEERIFGGDHCFVFELTREDFFRITKADVPLASSRSSFIQITDPS